MEIREIEGLRWPTPEKLRRIAERKPLSSNELLALKSRSFYLPIHMLQLARGNEETNKREIITDLYNVLREQDTIEDANPNIMDTSSKVVLMRQFVYILNQITRREPSEPIDDLIRENLSGLTEILVKGVMNKDEEIFVRSFGKGGVLERIRATATGDIKDAILTCVASMEVGMERFLKKNRIEKIPELEEYCSYVAADVGKALNRIVKHSDVVDLDDGGAKMFGRSLQMTNVLKNINEDWTERRVIYLPKELYPDVSDEELFDMENSHGRSVRKEALDTMVSNTRRDLRKSADYIGSVPGKLSGYQAFTMIPFFTAVETLRAMEKGGAEAVFRGDGKAVKASPEAFQNIARFSYSLALGGGKMTEEFMELYKQAQDREEHSKYCFDPERFEKWSKELFE